MSRVALADVLWDAANLHLLGPAGEFTSRASWGPSCCAVMQAARPRWLANNKTLHEMADKMPAFRFLRSLGCDTHTFAMCDQDDPQGVRYMWLLLAMHVAEDEGIEIERGAA